MTALSDGVDSPENLLFRSFVLPFQQISYLSSMYHRLIKLIMSLFLHIKVHSGSHVFDHMTLVFFINQ